MLSRFILFGIGFLTLCGVQAQSVQISRYVPGNSSLIVSNTHRIDVFNASTTRSVDLSGYVLVTRKYLIELPQGTRLAPLRSLKLGINGANGEIDISYQQMKTYIPRDQSGPEKGDFCAFFSPKLDLIDAFFFNPTQDVEFLPTQIIFTDQNGSSRNLIVPQEKDPRWSFLSMEPDPLMSFVRIEGNWEINSLRNNLFPATQYRSIQAKYIDGGVKVNWRTAFERDCYFHTVERSTDGTIFTELQSIKAGQQSKQQQTYSCFDQGIEKNRVYYYRVRHTDKFGNIIRSTHARVRTDENPDGYSLEVSQDEANLSNGLSVRFSANETQKVRLHIMDEEFREISTLYYGEIEAGQQNLINFRSNLPIGKYYVILSTEELRLFEPLIVD
ncbi:MAG: hypothetical protein AAF206_06180 [Bacteroidota bacterium]